MYSGIAEAIHDASFEREFVVGDTASVSHTAACCWKGQRTRALSVVGERTPHRFVRNDVLAPRTRLRARDASKVRVKRNERIHHTEHSPILRRRGTMVKVDSACVKLVSKCRCCASSSSAHCSITLSFTAPLAGAGISQYTCHAASTSPARPMINERVVELRAAIGRVRAFSGIAWSAMLRPFSK